MHIQKIIKRTLKVGVLAVALLTSGQVMGQTLPPNPTSYYDINENREIRLRANNDQSNHNEGISFYTAQQLAVRIGHGGNVGIGVYNPEHKLQVDGKIYSSSLEATDLVKALSFNVYSIYSRPHSPGLVLAPSGAYDDNTNIHFRRSGRVGIGVFEPQAKLHVAGDMKATTGTFSSNLQAVGGTFSGNLSATNGTFSGDLSANRVRLNVGSFPDYVFASGYDLMPLEQVEAYIKAHKHLPKVPSAAKVIKEGMNVGQMNILLMEKVEELTLHLIAQNKKMKAMQQKIAALEKNAADKK